MDAPIANAHSLYLIVGTPIDLGGVLVLADRQPGPADPAAVQVPDARMTRMITVEAEPE